MHRMDLDRVIEHLEQTIIKNSPAPDVTRLVVEDFRKDPYKVDLDKAHIHRKFLKSQFPSLPDEPTPRERLSDLLPVLWADHRLWWFLSRKPPEKPILKGAVFAYLLLKFYGLHIPFSDSFWLELRGQAPKWNHLQFLMPWLAERFFYPGPASSKDELSESEDTLLNETLLGKLLERYVKNPQRDWRPLLSSMNFPVRVLRRIAQATANLSEDARWCQEHPGQLASGRAPKVGHRIRSLADVRTIEIMVEAVRQNPQTSDYELAKKCLGRIEAGDRKLAKDAKKLAMYRDSIPVKFHKSHGDKNMPSSPP
jgi:hypothetical protein